MKKLIAIILVATIFCLSGCDNSDIYLDMARDFIAAGDISSAKAVLEKGLTESDNAEIKAMLEGLNALQTEAVTTDEVVVTTEAVTEPEETEVVTTEAVTEPEETEVVTTEAVTEPEETEVVTTEETATTTAAPKAVEADYSAYEGIWYSDSYKIIFTGSNNYGYELDCTGQFFVVDEKLDVSEIKNGVYTCKYYNVMMDIDELITFEFKNNVISMGRQKLYPDGSKSETVTEYFESKDR